MKEQKEYIATRNACKLCTPLGACLAYKGIKGCVPLIHGSQGCATYIRRYMISHFREPVDIASSNFSEESTIFGGKQNCHAALSNIIKQYEPEVVAITTTCLSETIGDDVSAFINEFSSESALAHLPRFVHASTPSYQGTHADGFFEAVLAAVKGLAEKTQPKNHINLFPGMFSPADLRYLKSVTDAYHLETVMLPDYSETIDGSSWSEYNRIPDGGTSIDEIRKTADAMVSIEFGTVFNKAGQSNLKKGSQGKNTASTYLEQTFGVPSIQMGWPMGVEACDRFFHTLTKLTGVERPAFFERERGRLIDAYADGHKYVFGKKAVIYGEEDLVLALYAFLNEIGVETILIASGGKSGSLNKQSTKRNRPMHPCHADGQCRFRRDCDLVQQPEARPDDWAQQRLLHCPRSKHPVGQGRVPIHDRLGGQRLRHIGYEGTNDLFERIVNAMIETNQNHSEVGYKFM